MMRLSTIRHKQTGSGLLLVVFIIVVVVGFVAAVANRNQERSSDQFIASVIGTRAELARALLLKSSLAVSIKPHLAAAANLFPSKR